MIRKIPITILMLVIYSQGFAQCLTSGPNNPSTASSIAEFGFVSWSDPLDALTSNNTGALATGLALGAKTEYLYVSVYGFSIPSTATICGIEVEVERLAGGIGFPNVEDESARIVKGGTITGSEYAKAGTWPTSFTYTTYGGNTDLWGTTWTPAEINASDFGFAIKADLISLSVLLLSSIDNIQMTVYYDNSLPIKLLNFEAERTSEDLVKLTWETGSETDNDFFTIERSTNGKNWEERGRLAGAGTSNKKLSYSLEDTNHLSTTTYYRLKQTDFNGDFEYSKVVNVHPLGSNSSSVNIFPVPSSGTFSIEASEEILQLDIYNIWGENIFSKDVNSDHVDINLSHKPKDVYFIKIHTSNSVVTKRVVIK